MSIVLDAGAFRAVERNQRDVLRWLEVAQRHRIDLRTTAIVVGQVWRTGRGRQATLARLLTGTEVIPVDHSLGMAAGALIGQAGSTDPIDATVVLVAQPGDTILTSDPDDIRQLIASSGSGAFVLSC